MDLTPQQRNAVRCDENALIEACPGSGKTRAIVGKVLRCLDEVRGSPRKIAVITYTNAAVYEIESRLRRYGSTGDLGWCDVSTIHSFCLTNILRAFCWRTEDYPEGFSLLPPESDEFQQIVQSVCVEFSLPREAAEQFQQLHRDRNGQPILRAGAFITTGAAEAFWQRLREGGKIDFSTVIYLTYRLLHDFPSLARALSCRYRWVLVDEFQDTSELQVEILKSIHDARESKLFLVGDPHQSIFGFAGARPALNDELATHVGARRDFQISQNWRSNPQIIAHAERLRPRAVPMISACEIARDPCAPIYAHCATAYEGIAQHFLPALARLRIPFGNAAVLAPSWFALVPIGQSLRRAGVPIIGPGARPYRGSLLFARLAEYVCEYIERRNPTLIRSMLRELNAIVADVTGGKGADVIGYPGRTTIFRLLQIGTCLRSEHGMAESWLMAAADGFGRQLVADGLLPTSAIELFTQSARAICEQMRSRDVDPAALPVSDLGLFAATDRSLRLLTMHAAKGLEWDAVALIGLNDGQIPNWRAASTDEIDENCRLLYVGITRAKRLLLYVSDRSRPRNRPSRFLGTPGLGLV